MSNKAIVLDANLLIRAVLGQWVRELIFENASKVKLFAPDVACDDARNYLPARWQLVAQSEQRMWISLALALPLGRLIALSCILSSEFETNI